MPQWVQASFSEKRRSLPSSGRSTMASPSARDRKSTRLNSSHLVISYAVFCLIQKDPRTRLVMVEDAVTTALSSHEAIQEERQAGGVVIVVASLVHTSSVTHGSGVPCIHWVAR